MSSYWDALIRTATGAAGSADPRPRALFEADAGLDSVSPDGFDVIDEEIEAPASLPGPARTQRPLLADRGPGAEVPSAAVTAGKANPVPPSELRVEPPAAQERARPDEPASTAIPAEVAQSSAPAAASPAEPLRLVDRLETLRTLVEVAEPVAPGEAVLRTETILSAEPAAVEAAVPHQLSAEPHAAVAAEPVDLHVGPESGPAPMEAPARAPLVIEIDRIEVRIVSEAAAVAPTPRRRETQTAPSLNDWLSRRGGAAP